MTAYPDLERRVTDLFADEAPQRAPDWLLSGALATIEVTSQRRVLIRMPRRFQDMNSYAKVAIAAVVVVAVGVVGLSFLGGGPGAVGRWAVASPSPSHRRAVALAVALHHPEPVVAAAVDRDVHVGALRLSRSRIPRAGPRRPRPICRWATKAGFLSPGGDWIYDPTQTDHLFIVVTSEALTGAAGETWAGDCMSNPDEGCEGDAARRPSRSMARTASFVAAWRWSG